MDKGIPIPIPYGRGRKKYPFEKMETGDSLAIKVESRQEGTTLIGSARSWSERNHKGKIKFTSVYKNGSFRIWRVGDGQEGEVKTEEVKIEKNVPSPGIQKTGAKKYPFECLKVGDSFKVAGIDSKTAQSVISCAMVWNNRHKGGRHKYSIRYYPEERYCRIWRIKNREKLHKVKIERSIPHHDASVEEEYSTHRYMNVGMILKIPVDPKNPHQVITKIRTWLNYKNNHREFTIERETKNGKTVSYIIERIR